MSVTPISEPSCPRGVPNDPKALVHSQHWGSDSVGCRLISHKRLLLAAMAKNIAAGKLLNDIHASHAFLHASKRSVPGASFDASETDQKKGLERKFKRCRLTAATATPLIEAVQSGPWSSGHRGELCQLMSSMVKPNATLNQCQTFMFMPTYCNKSLFNHFVSDG